MFTANTLGCETIKSNAVCKYFKAFPSLQLGDRKTLIGYLVVARGLMSQWGKPWNPFVCSKQLAAENVAVVEGGNKTTLQSHSFEKRFTHSSNVRYEQHHAPINKTNLARREKNYWGRESWTLKNDWLCEFMTIICSTVQKLLSKIWGVDRASSLPLLALIKK